MNVRAALASLLLASTILCVPANADPLAQAVAGDYPYLKSLFEELHANPELSMQEDRTSDRLAKELEQLGYKVARRIGKTGLVGTLRNGDGPTLLIRADMDALPVQEKTGLPYASTKRQVDLEGRDVPVMHACGHDMHVTTLVGVARRMVALKDRWRGTLLLVGQPAEEALGGAKAMVADGIYERVGRPDFALALHVIAKYPAGKVAFSDGLMYSSADTVRINVRTRATHGASPHLGHDPVVIGSQIVLALQNIVTREINPIEPALITVGAFNAGTRRVRGAMERGMGPDAFVTWYQSDMGAEDFPDLVNVKPPIPSVYFEVGGTAPERLASGDWADHHSPLFRIEPEPSIKAGVQAMTLAALELLAKK
jgi:hippurate hydrolase